MIGENKRFSDIYYIRKIINIFRTIKLKKQWYCIKDGVSESIKKDCIIYCADGHIAHGGLADRMYGLMAIYALCKMQHVPFYIFWDTPYDLSLFLVPNKYDWCIKKSQIIYDKRLSVPRCLLGGAMRLPKNAIRIKKRKQVHVYCNFKNLSFITKKYETDISYKALFKELFKFSPAFSETLADYKAMLPTEYSGLQVRVLNAFGDFPDSVDNTLTYEEQDSLIDLCCNKIKQIYNETSQSVLFTSDSQILIDNVKKKLGANDILVTIPGEITHTDSCTKQNESPYELHKKTFIDLFLLSDSANLYQICDEHIYKSGFSILAAKISGKEVQFI